MRTQILGALAVALHVAAAGCGDAGNRSPDSAGATAATSSAAAGSAATDSEAPGRPACPATGLWTRCAVVERLDRAGLAPQVDSAAVQEPGLGVPGFLVRLGRGELEVYLYPDVASRERAQAALDRAKYLEYQNPVSMAEQPTLIVSGNAIAVLHSRNDHQRERVGDAITAGAPARTP